MKSVVTKYEVIWTRIAIHGCISLSPTLQTCSETAYQRGHKSGENRSPESSIARISIGNGFPVQKYIGAMVRKSIRVVLVAENDLVEVDSEILDSKIIKNKGNPKVNPSLFCT